MADKPGDEEFERRRQQAREHLESLTGTFSDDPAERTTWFEHVYEDAGRDPASVPWADLAPKDALVEWLASRPGDGRRAVDVACGLGDNAEAIAAAGYRTTAFDLADGAIRWAQERFPDTQIAYRQADLFDLPADWSGAFDLVHENYTIQALRDSMRERAFGPIADLVSPGGTLLVITRSREEGEETQGPPWPLAPSELARFEAQGLEMVASEAFVVERPGRIIPHMRIEYRKPG